MQTHFRFSLLLFISYSAGLSLPRLEADPTFGGEIEFTNAEIDGAQYDFGGDTWRLSDESSDYQDRFHDAVLEQCRGCSIRLLWDHDGVATYRVTYPDGWWFQISMDPHVIEIQTKPATLKKLRSIRQRIQKDIFDVAKKIGLKAGVKDSGGHIHIGVDSAFGDDAQLFRNFIVDFINHSELANGILVNDHSNAPPLQALSAEQKKAFMDVIQEFDDGKRKTIRDIAEGMISHVYGSTTEPEWAPPEKFHALNITRIFEIYLFNKPDRTVEIRALRGQKNADEFILEAQLFEARLNYLKTLKEPLKVTWGPKAHDLQAKIDAYHRYVVEAGLAWEPYRALLPARFQKVVPTAIKNGAAPLLMNPLNSPVEEEVEVEDKKSARKPSTAQEKSRARAGTVLQRHLQPVAQWTRRMAARTQQRLLAGSDKLGVVMRRSCLQQLQLLRAVK